MRDGPIAIVGTGCVLPGALSPDELLAALRDRRDLTSAPPPGAWRISVEEAIADLGPGITPPEVMRGAYVRGFDEVFDPTGLEVPEHALRRLDPVVRWPLHSARQALAQAGLLGAPELSEAGFVLGNLSYPTRGMVEYAEGVWWGDGDDREPRNRFMSGLPAALTAQALGLGGASFCFDAACASSLYAIALACDRLRAGDARVMLAGGVNHVDDLFLHMGFTALTALSPTGRSRPFHEGADGLLPAEGAGVVVLQRLEDALAEGREVLGVVRGVGLSNDGRGRSLLTPESSGQVRALRSAYENAGVDPREVGFVECHATGTVVGDSTEVRSMAEVFGAEHPLVLGSMKSNMGHLITAAGIAGVIKTLACMRAEVLAPSLSTSDPVAALGETRFRLLAEETRWESDGPRVAGVSAFGFGGNNAHVVLEQFVPGGRLEPRGPRAPASAAKPEVGVIGIHTRLGEGRSPDRLARAVLDGGHVQDRRIETVDLPLRKVRFPPTDLRACLAQQLLPLAAAIELEPLLEGVDRERVAVLVGMGTDAEGCRYGARWGTLARLDATELDACGGYEHVLDGFTTRMSAEAGLGHMPNLVANRINSQLDLGGPSFSVSAEEASGTRALALAVEMLEEGTVDLALVGAVDCSDEPVHRAAAAVVMPESRRDPADACVMLVLERAADAAARGRPVLARVAAGADEGAGLRLDLDGDPGRSTLTGRTGHAHAASGLLHVAGAVEAQARRAVHDPGLGAVPWQPNTRPRVAEVTIAPLGGGSQSLRVLPGDAVVPHVLTTPGLEVHRAGSVAALARRLEAGEASGGAGPYRLALVAPEPGGLARRRRDAAAALKKGTEPGAFTSLGEGIYLGTGEPPGELAFVFTGPAGAYRGMGRELLLAFPELRDLLAGGYQTMDSAVGWIYGSPEADVPPAKKLWASSIMSQLHARFTQDVLGLEATAAIGYCSGETNSLYAMGAWEDFDDLRRRVEERELFVGELGGELRAVRRAWELGPDDPVSWAGYRVFATVEEARDAVRDEPRVHLAIHNAPGDVVISGEAEACRRVVAAIGEARARPLGYDIAVHCPEARAFYDDYLAIHTRPTRPVPGVRFYSSSFPESYTPDEGSAARALTDQAMDFVDFPKTIEKAYADGVRVFLEHGPHAGCTKWIRRILGDRPAVCVAMDDPGRSSLLQAVDAAARLYATGVDVSLDKLRERLGARPEPVPEGPRLEVAAHRAPVELPGRRASARPPEAPEAPETPEAPGITGATQRIPLPPALPATDQLWRPGAVSGRAHAAPVHEPVHPPGPVTAQALATQAHQEFLAAQVSAHQRFLAFRQAATRTLAAAVHGGGGALWVPPPEVPGAVAPTPASGVPAAPARPAPPEEPTEPAVDPAHPKRGFPGHCALIDPKEPAPVPPEPLPRAEPVGPTFDYEALKIHATGKISEIFGPEFERQDGYHRQVRMPGPPLLFAHRCTGAAGVPGGMGLGTMWTETDVRDDAWYLHEGRMPTGVMIEAGQADLMLISWLGIDWLNQGERFYRLLGSQFTFHGSLPRPGETLRFQIQCVDHANFGDIRLFFFQYDCYVDGELRLSVREGQAGFFNEAELAESAGVLWRAEDIAPNPSWRSDPPVALTKHRSFTHEQVRAFSEGRVDECFGPGFERARVHTKTPRIQPGRMLLFDEVEEFDPNGGPWGRGYMRTVMHVKPDHWFFPGHFLNDPCMPGTLMCEGGFQAMSFYMAAHGHTLDRDGWRFEPGAGEPAQLYCRGQVSPTSKKLHTELFIQEFHDGPEPILYASLLGTVDGLKAMSCERVAFRLVPDWPLDRMPELMEGHREARPVYVRNGHEYGRHALLTCSLGKPSEIFGPDTSPTTPEQKIARLPGPPYLMASRVVDARRRDGDRPARAVLEYDVPADCWYFDEAGNDAMPFGFLLEVGLQPCGWLSFFAGDLVVEGEDLYFRNLDGVGRALAEVRRDAGVLRTETVMTNLSRLGAMNILEFEVVVYQGQTRVYEMTTSFGTFPAEALESQAGLEDTPEERARVLDEPGEVVDLTSRPAAFFGGPLGTAGRELMMLHRITGLWPEGGAAGLGRIRGEMDVDPGQWFFQAHFYQDPVQPGSLGLEAMVQALQLFAIQRGMGEGVAAPRFESVAPGHDHTWKYRGQVRPAARRVVVDVEVTEAGDRELVAAATLWVDGMKIYSASGLALRVVPG